MGPMSSSSVRTATATDPVAGAPAASNWGYRPALDGLRTIAVYLVVLYHAGLATFEGGFVGVDLFFALSGFLVCNVVLAEVDKRGHLRLGHFYARRVRRLLPAAVLLVVVTSVAYLLVAPQLSREPLVADARSALLYYSNWHFLFESSDYFATDVEKSPFLHFWSLSIEEQYYLVFPLLIAGLVALGKLTPRWLLGVLGALCVASIAAQVYWARIDVSHSYYGTDARLYQLLAGALLAVALRTWQVRISARAAGLLALAGAVGIVVIGTSLVPYDPSGRGLLATVASVGVIAGLSLGDRSPTARVLSWRAPVYLGQISYGTYLWHWPVILVLAQLGLTEPWRVALATIVIGTACAAASYHLFEMPIRTSGRLSGIRWPTVVVGVGVSALVAVTVVPLLLKADTKPVEAAQQWPGQELPEEGQPIPVPEDFDPEQARGGGITHTCAADEPEACEVVSGDGPHVLVVGDSQGQMFGPMFEALAREHDLQLSLNVLPGCPWQEQIANSKQGASEAERCMESRDGWYDTALPEIDPDVVFVTSRDRDVEEEWGDVLSRRDGEEQSLEDMTHDLSFDTMEKITAVAPKVLVTTHLPMPESFDPNACLTATDDARDCAAPVTDDESFTDGVAQEMTDTFPEVETIDMGPAFCLGDGRCEAYLDGLPTFRDNHHYSLVWIDHQLDEAWKILGPKLTG